MDNVHDRDYLESCGKWGGTMGLLFIILKFLCKFKKLPYMVVAGKYYMLY